MGIVSCCALFCLILFLIAESFVVRYARKQFSLVIHVNGTRGKSTVTRMVHALLSSQGMEVYGKTTGSAARFLLPDGAERPVRRFAPANVREQRNMMLLSAFLAKRASPEKRKGAALVFECNAIQEELQRISARWLKPDITIVTNVREDHVGELGTAEDAARAFAAAIPGNSVLVTSDGKFTAVWEAAAKQKNFALRYVASSEAGDCEFPENAACVLGVADLLGIDRKMAMKAIGGYKPDAGAFRLYSWRTGSHSVFFADARAANDTESTHRLLLSAFPALRQNEGSRQIFLLINRNDRPDRTWRFMRYIADRRRELPFDQYLCFGHTPLLFRRTMKCERINCAVFQQIKNLDNMLEEIPEDRVYIFAAGNYDGKGQQITRWLDEKRRRPDFRQISEASLMEELR